MARCGLVISYLATNRSPTYSCVVHLLRSRQRYRGVKKLLQVSEVKEYAGFILKTVQNTFIGNYLCVLFIWIVSLLTYLIHSNGYMVLYKKKNHCKLRLKVNMELLFTSWVLKINQIPIYNVSFPSLSYFDSYRRSSLPRHQSISCRGTMYTAVSLCKQ